VLRPYIASLALRESVESMKKKSLKIRDHLMVKLINGATKASVEADAKKESDRLACREEPLPALCKECFTEYADDDGFCSDYCMNEYDKAMNGEKR
jgi:hypothetical protein